MAALPARRETRALLGEEICPQPRRDPQDNLRDTRPFFCLIILSTTNALPFDSFLDNSFPPPSPPPPVPGAPAEGFVVLEFCLLIRSLLARLPGVRLRLDSSSSVDLNL